MVAKCLGRRDPDLLLRVDQRIDQERQKPFLVDVRQGQDRRVRSRAAVSSLPPQTGSSLHVVRGLLEDIGPVVLELVQRLDDRQLGPAQLVVLEGIDQERTERGLQRRGQLRQPLVAGNRRRGGDDEIGLVRQCLAHLGRHLGRGVPAAQCLHRGELVVQR